MRRTGIGRFNSITSPFFHLRLIETYPFILEMFIFCPFTKIAYPFSVFWVNLYKSVGTGSLSAQPGMRSLMENDSLFVEFTVILMFPSQGYSDIWFNFISLLPIITLPTL